MADSILCSGGASGNPAYVEKSGLAVNASTTTIYVGFQLYLPAATLANWGAAAGSSPYLLELDGLGGAGVYLYDTNSDGTYDVFEDSQIGDTTGVPTGDTWVKLEWQQDPTNSNGPETVTLDGTPIGTATFGPFQGPFGNMVDDVEIGPRRFSGFPSDEDVYVGEIRIGTAADAFDLFHFLPATAPDLSAFDSVVGTVSLATAPSAPPSWGGGGGDVTPPTRTGITVDGSTVTISYDEALETVPGPDPSEFVVTVNSVPRAVYTAEVSGSDVLLTLASPVFATDTVTVTYTG